MSGPNGPDRQSDAEGQRGKAMSSEAAGRVYGQHSGYRKLKAYQVAELLYSLLAVSARGTFPGPTGIMIRWCRRREVVIKTLPRAAKTAQRARNWK